MSKLDRSSLQKLTPRQRKELQRDLAAAARAPEGGQQRPVPRRGGPSVTFLLVYGLLCATGGVYFDRHLLAETRLWFSDQVAALSGFGSEQEIQGLLERAGTSQTERELALRDVRAVYRAQRQQTLGAGALEELRQAELVLERSRRAGTEPSDEELSAVLAVYRELAAGL